MNNSNIPGSARSSFIRDEWPILLALIAVSILYSLLAQALDELISSPFASSLIIRLISLTLSGTLVILIVVAWLAKKPRFSFVILIFFNSVVTVYLLSGVFLLVGSLTKLHGTEAGLILLRDAAVVWVINVLIFAIWFWILDGGGPSRRGKDVPSIEKDFLFFQEESSFPGWEHWHPNYNDYLILALFNCSTFGPTDVRVLSRRGKLLVATQVIISLLTLTMFVARALSLIS